MKKWFPSTTKLILILFLTGFVGKLGDVAATWLLENRQIIPIWLAHSALVFLPSQKALLTLSRDLYWVCIPMLVIPFSYTFIREWIYVDRMYVKRDLLEAGKLKPSDLTREEFNFIYVHWPDLFKK